MEYPRWSEWRKWDLHIHTPKSIINAYWWDTDEIWENFITALENLPEEVKVIWTTDYYFIDWYEKVMDYKQQWRLKNIEKIFPILEFRIDTFWSWNENKLQKINLHILFNLNEKNIKEEIKKVKESFIGLIPITRLEKHKTKMLSRDHFIGECGNLQEWFNNLIPSTDKVFELIKSQEWIDKTFLFLGYKEWSNLDKNNQIKPFKEDLYNKVGAFFSSNFEKFEDNQKWLNEFWKKKLLHSLDIHDMNTLTTNYFCNTRIKWDPTFEWLKQILYEPEERVCIWKEPEILQKVSENKTEYISSLNIKRGEWYNGSKGVRFKDEKIKLNHWLVTIIWNKWSWKSALVDIIWYLWNTKQYEKSSFLSRNRFLKDGLANNFNASLIFEDWSSIDKNLWEKIWESSLERVRYLPQNYFNDITNEIESIDFVDTINNVVFNHLPESERLWKVSFKEFVNLKTEVAKSNIGNISAKISSVNKEIVELEISMQPVEIEKLENQKNLKEQELKAQKESLSELKKEKPKTTTKKNSNWKQLKNMEILNKKLWDLDSDIQKITLELSNLAGERQELNTIKSKLQSFEKIWKDFIKEYKKKIEEFDIKINDILKITVSYTKIDKKLRDVDKKIQEKKELLMSEVEINDISDLEIKNKIQKTSLVIKRNSIIQEQDKIKKALSDVELKQQEYNEKIKKIEQKIKDIEWNENIPNTLKYLERKISDLTKRNKNWKTQVEEKLLEKEQQRNELLNEIFNEKERILNLYGKFKEPIDRIIQNFEDSQININVDFQIDKNFYIEFFKYINQSKKGSFYWKDEGNDMLNKIMDWKDVSSFKWIENLLNTIVDYLKNDKRDWKNEKSNIFEQIKDIEWFYNYLFSLKYLDVNYELKSWDKVLDQLSPWEKWNLLLIFYLMIDKETIPLVIDQPEDNLDNKSVFEMLSKFIKEAKRRRQIILVTHNPNLAIWADAEQIIYTEIDKKDWKNKFSYISWSIENPTINNKIVEILEWTMPAFQKRELKYQK